MIDLINELYDELDSIFKEHTTHQWKNGWQHEGDIESNELTIQEKVMFSPQVALELSTTQLFMVGSVVSFCSCRNITSETCIPLGVLLLNRKSE